MAQSGVLRFPRVQLIRGLARTMEPANLSANSQTSLPQVSSTAGRHPGEKLIPTRADHHALDASAQPALFCCVVRHDLCPERELRCSGSFRIGSEYNSY